MTTFDGLSREQLETFTERYDADEVENIVAAVDAAVKHPELNYSELLPEGVVVSRDAVNDFLLKVHASLSSLPPRKV